MAFQLLTKRCVEILAKPRAKEFVVVPCAGWPVWPTEKEAKGFTSEAYGGRCASKDCDGGNTAEGKGSQEVRQEDFEEVLEYIAAPRAPPIQPKDQARSPERWETPRRSEKLSRGRPLGTGEEADRSIKLKNMFAELGLLQSQKYGKSKTSDKGKSASDSGATSSEEPRPERRRRRKGSTKDLRTCELATATNVTIKSVRRRRRRKAPPRVRYEPRGVVPVLLDTVDRARPAATDTEDGDGVVPADDDGMNDSEYSFERKSAGEDPAAEVEELASSL